MAAVFMRECIALAVIYNKISIYHTPAQLMAAGFNPAQQGQRIAFKIQETASAH
jgi:hypothetical protein